MSSTNPNLMVRRMWWQAVGAFVAAGVGAVAVISRAVTGREVDLGAVGVLILALATGIHAIRRTQDS